MSELVLLVAALAGLGVVLILEVRRRREFTRRHRLGHLPMFQTARDLERLDRFRRGAR